MALITYHRNSRHCLTLKEAVFNHSKSIHSYLSVQHLIAELTNTKLEFLSPNELSKLYGVPGEQNRAGQLLLYLKTQGSNNALRKFVASLVLEKDHRGHQYICHAILKDMPKPERRRIFKTVKQVLSSKDYSNEEDIIQTCSKIYSEAEEVFNSDNQLENQIDSDLEDYQQFLPRPPGLITLVDCLEGRRFDRVDRKLWNYFSTGQYDHLQTLTTRLQLQPSLDKKIIGMWFESLIFMHRDGNNDDCLTRILFPALELCSNAKNSTILRGRVLQRIAQVFLVSGKKTEAQKHLEWAEQELQFVGKCYETVNMHCRRAKILSTTCENRQTIEEEYSVALNAFTDDDPFALASRPSLILSKTAFHLHISFGARPSLNQTEPVVGADDLMKAEATLSGLSDEMLFLDMRRSEKKLIEAELQRLNGNESSSMESFKSIVKETTDKNFQNLKAIAENRLHLMTMNSSENDELLEGLP